jgi:DNA polymerase
MKIYRDYETLSAVDLNKTGAEKYAQHPSTEPICLAIKLVDDEGEDMSVLWVNPKFVSNLPVKHGLLLIDSDGLMRLYARRKPTESHNDPFERAIDNLMWLRYKITQPNPEDRSCSMSQALTNALPAKLETLSEALNLGEQSKDSTGHDLMLKTCKPLSMNAARWRILDIKFGAAKTYQQAKMIYKHAESGKGKTYATYIADNWQNIIDKGYDPQDFLFWHIEECPEDLLKLCRYCLQDVEAEYAASKKMPPMSNEEQEMWQIDQKINRRGVHIDRKGAQNVVHMVHEYKLHRESELSKLTDGFVTKASQIQKIREWCDTVGGVFLPNGSKDMLEYFLGTKTLPDTVRKVLEIRLACSQTSTTKYEAMLRAASDEDNRVRGVFRFAGASTGRWTALLLQLHNMPRGTIKLKTDAAIDAAYQAMTCGWQEVELLYGDVMQLAASAVRGCITAAPGYELLASDFSSIEARMVLWLANDQKGLQVYIDMLDAYKVSAATIFGAKPEDVTDKQRLVGKVSILSLGFGGGIGAFASMARNYGIDLETLVPLILPSASGYELQQARSTATTYLENLEVQIKRKLEHDKGKATFRDRMSIEAAMACDIIKQRWRRDHPLVTGFWKELEAAAFQAIQNPAQIFNVGKYISFGMSGDYLLMRLPSGRCLRYYKPKISRREKFGSMANAITYLRMVDGQWIRTATYGAKTCENATQASSNCLLRHVIHKIEQAGYSIVLHAHDEPVVEVPTGTGDLDEYNKLMLDTPSWAAGLPMEAEGWRGRRYRKV